MHYTSHSFVFLLPLSFIFILKHMASPVSSSADSNPVVARPFRRRPRRRIPWLEGSETPLPAESSFSEEKVDVTVREVFLGTSMYWPTTRNGLLMRTDLAS